MPVSSQGRVGKGGFPDGRGPETDLKKKNSHFLKHHKLEPPGCEGRQARPPGFQDSVRGSYADGTTSGPGVKAPRSSTLDGPHPP